jgi:hypothetical protein
MLVALKRRRLDWFGDLGSFAVMVAIAAWQRWEAKDLIWGLWISSLVVGYSFILVTARSSYATDNIPEMPRGKKADAGDGPPPGAQSRVPTQVRRLQPLAMNVFVVFVAFMILGVRSEIPWTLLLFNIGFGAIAVMLSRGVRGSETFWHKAARRFFLLTPSVIFFLGFFTVHFGGFHFVHGLFLNGFFPLVEGSPFGESPGGTLVFFASIIGAAVSRYWVFILFSAWSRLPDLRRAFEKAEGPNMFLPYANVVRMHLLIFVFAGLSAAGLTSWALYPVLFFYFFPLGKMLKGVFGGREKGRAKESRLSRDRTLRRHGSFGPVEAGRSIPVPQPRVMAGEGLAEGEVVVGAAALCDAEGEGDRAD